jgi:two-component system sensor histidine kinase DesK
LQAATIKFHLEKPDELPRIPLIIENVVSMCLKEAVTNVVKHSQASKCAIIIKALKTELTITISDNGIGIGKSERNKNSGLQGMKERLEFVNGHLKIEDTNGTNVIINVPVISNRKR